MVSLYNHIHISSNKITENNGKEIKCYNIECKLEVGVHSLSYYSKVLVVVFLLVYFKTSYTQPMPNKLRGNISCQMFYQAPMGQFLLLFVLNVLIVLISLNIRTEI